MRADHAVWEFVAFEEIDEKLSRDSEYQGAVDRGELRLV